MIPLLLALLATATSTPPPEGSAQQAVMICGQSGGVNNGIYVASCLPGMKLLRPTSIDEAKPLVLTDGTFVHEFVFEAPKVQSWETTMCGPGLLDFNIVGLSGLSVVMQKLPASESGCITKQFVNVSGVFSLVIRTQGSRPRIEMRTVYIPVNPSVLTQYTPEAMPVETYVPMVIMPPPSVASMPLVGSPGGLMPGLGGPGLGGMISAPVAH